MFPPGKITRQKFPEVSTNAEKISHGQRGATAGSHDMQKSALHRCRRPAGLFWPLALSFLKCPFAGKKNERNCRKMSRRPILVYLMAVMYTANLCAFWYVDMDCLIFRREDNHKVERTSSNHRHLRSILTAVLQDAAVTQQRDCVLLTCSFNTRESCSRSREA